MVFKLDHCTEEQLVSKQISDKVNRVEICVSMCCRNGKIVQPKPATPTSAATRRACDAVKSRGAELKVFMEQSSPCPWDNVAVKLYVFPREESACQHEFKTNSRISSL